MRRQVTHKSGKTKFVAELEPGEWPALRTAMCLAVAQGRKVPAVAKEFLCDVGTVVFALRSQKSIQIRSAHARAEIADRAWRNELASLSAGNLLRHAQQLDEQEQIEYNDAKILQGNLKGLGEFKVGESVGTLNQQNNFFLTEEQAARILELGNKAGQPAIIETTAATETDGGAAGDPSEDQERPAVVAEERDQDL